MKLGTSQPAKVSSDSRYDLDKDMYAVPDNQEKITKAPKEEVNIDELYK